MTHCIHFSSMLFVQHHTDIICDSQFHVTSLSVQSHKTCCCNNARCNISTFENLSFLVLLQNSLNYIRQMLINNNECDNSSVGISRMHNAFNFVLQFVKSIYCFVAASLDCQSSRKLTAYKYTSASLHICCTSVKWATITLALHSYVYMR